MNFFSTIKSNYFWWWDNNWIEKAEMESQELVVVLGNLKSCITELESSIKKQENFIEGQLEINENLQELLREQQTMIETTSTKPKKKLMELNVEIEIIRKRGLKLSDANPTLAGGLECLQAKESLDHQ